jgi:glycine oxidase
VIDHWAGLRPVSPDGLPILGADPEQPRLLYACGFSRNGILFAPWAAHQLTALAASELPSGLLDSFSVARFVGIS